MFTDTKRKPYEAPTVRRISPEEAEEKLSKAVDADRRDATEVLETIRHMKSA